MPDEVGDGGSGKRPPQDFHHPKAFPLQAPGRFLDPRIVTLGEHDALPGAPRPLVRGVAKAHRANFCSSAWRTAGWTSGATLPPNRATSRTRLDERYVRSNAGTRNTVSIPGARLRFIRAIWNSYSKSLTARRPRTITAAPAARAKSASSRSEEHTSELQSQSNLVCRLLLEKKKKNEHPSRPAPLPQNPQ